MKKYTLNISRDKACEGTPVPCSILNKGQEEVRSFVGRNFTMGTLDCIMKRGAKILCFLALSLLALSCTYEGDKVVKIQELPNNEIYEIDGHHVDLGVSFQQDGIKLGFNLPYHNYGDPEYVLFYKSKWTDQYDWHTYSLDQEDIQYFVDVYGIPNTPQLPLWDRVSVVFGVVLMSILAIAGVILIIRSVILKIQDWF
jgi:hypothetical protein